MIFIPKKYTIILLFFCLNFHLLAQNLASNLIPDSLLKNAHLVIREKNMVLNIESVSKATYSLKTIFTILDASENNRSLLTCNYSPDYVLKDFKASVYDAQGKLIKKFNSSEWIDRAANDGVSIFNDDRVKLIDLEQKKYPYTIVFEEKYLIKNLLYLPRIQLYSNYKEAIEHFSLSIDYPDDFPIIFEYQNGFLEASSTINSKTNQHHVEWNFHHLKALPVEQFTPNLTYYSPLLFIIPSQLKVGSYQGPVQTWQEFAQLFSKIYFDHNQLNPPSKLVQEIQKLVENESDTLQIIKKIYKYLQHNTHYISVQLGAGGFIPFSTNYVYKNKYGDCKALSNFMVALLKTQGIKGFPIIIEAGITPALTLNATLTGNLFNHVITGVIYNQDTLFFECTSQTLSPGYLSDFTANRRGLMIDENGQGGLIATKSYTENENVYYNYLNGQMTNDGTIKANLFSKSSALAQDFDHNLYFSHTPEERLNIMNKMFKYLKNATISNLSFNVVDSIFPIIEENMDLNIPFYGNITGKRLILNMNMLNRQFNVPLDSARIAPIYSGKAMTFIDSIVLSLPENFSLNELPTDFILQSDLGSYESRYKIINNNLIYFRKYIRYGKVLPASDFNSFRMFNNKIYQRDNFQLIFTKK